METYYKVFLKYPLIAGNPAVVTLQPDLKTVER